MAFGALHLVFLCALVCGVVVEAARCWRPPRLRIDGQPVTDADPSPPGIHQDQRVELK